jgi:hypothetical protein
VAPPPPPAEPKAEDPRRVEQRKLAEAAREQVGHPLHYSDANIGVWHGATGNGP